MTAHTSSPPATLEELVAPLTETEFLALLRERKLTLQRATSPDRYKGILKWDRLLELLDQGQYPRGRGEVRIVKESKNISPERWLKRNKDDNQGGIDTAKVRDYVAGGHSLLVMPVQAHVPPLAALCESIRERVGERIRAGVIVTEGTGGAFHLHFDPEDLIILQVEGTKRWRIYGPPVPNPVVGMPPHPPPQGGEPILDEVLRPGDFLFLPAGNWHHCQNGLGRSLHLGIFLVPPTGWYAARDLVVELVSDEVLRKPLARAESDTELAALEAEIKNRLVERISGLNLREFAAGWPTKQS